VTVARAETCELPPYVSPHQQWWQLCNAPLPPAYERRHLSVQHCRASAELLLCELAEEFDGAALSAVLEAVSRRLAEADAAAAAAGAGSAGSWWAMREACIMALGACSDQLVQV
jgi:hypothetical protein